MSWPTGIAKIKELLSVGHLERTPPDREAALEVLDTAGLHLASATMLLDADPVGSYQLAYDGFRKTLSALLLTQGLRATAKGGHIAIQHAIEAQFTMPPPSKAFAAYGRMRSRRNGAEYTPRGSIDRDEAAAGIADAEAAHAVAEPLLPELPVFTG